MKSALIFGSTGDIGEAVAYKFASEGYSLYLHYFQNHKKVLRMHEDLQKSYPQQDFFVVCLDMRKTEQLDAFLSKLFQVDVLVFAEGTTHYSLLSETSENVMEELWQMHLLTPMLVCQKLENKLAQQHQGRIVFVSSVYGITGSAMESVYSVVKAGQINFVKSYAREVASRGIVVNAVAPGAVDTKMNGNFSNSEKQEIIEEIPVGRFATANEIAEGIYFLANEKNEVITGTTLKIDGGWT